MLNNIENVDYTNWRFKGFFKLSVIDTLTEANHRGACDYYYGRGCKPNYRYQDSRSNKRYVTVEECDMSEAEINAYNKGYEEETDMKEWL